MACRCTTRYLVASGGSAPTRGNAKNARVARAMFTDAINDGLHAGPNPFSNLRLEQPRGRRDLVALTEAELVRLADCAPQSLGAVGPTFRAMILFAAYVGLRPGELFALERRDVAQDEVTIRQSLDGTGQIKAPKNGRVGTVILPPPARVDVPWLFVTPADASSRSPATCTTGERFGRGSRGPRWTSTSCGTSALPISLNSASLTLTSRSSSGTRTAERSSCPHTGILPRLPPASG